MNVDKCPCCNYAEKFDFIPYDKNPSEPGWTYNCFTNLTLAFCSSCGSYFTYEVLSDNELNLFYKTLFSKTDDRRPAYSHMHEFNPRFFSQVVYLKSNIDLFDGIQVLEIGPNSTGVLPTLGLFCRPRYFYFEQNKYPIIEYFNGKRLGEYFSKENFKKQTQVERFDLVYMSHSLEHVNPSSLTSIIDLIYSTLNENGHLFIEVPDQIMSAKFPPHTLFFTVEGLVKLFENAGFRIIGMQKIDATQAKPVKSGRSLLSWLIQKNISLSVKIPFLMKLFRPFLQRLVLKDKLMDLDVPYSAIPYIRIVAKRVHQYV